MEVHKHSHDHAHKKKWTGYLLEFFMLFLAVFLGFIAENIREGVVEKQREKEFIRSLVNDLRLDTTWMNTVTASALEKVQHIDSAMVSLRSASDEIPYRVYQNLQQSAVQVMFFPNEGTMTQLKNSGGMRLIRSRIAVDSIEAYDRLMRRLEVRRAITNDLVHDFIQALNRSITGTDLLPVLYDSQAFKTMPVEKQVVRIDHQHLNELINACLSVRWRALSDINANNTTKESATNLILFLNKDYHLKNE